MRFNFTLQFACHVVNFVWFVSSCSNLSLSGSVKELTILFTCTEIFVDHTQRVYAACAPRFVIFWEGTVSCFSCASRVLSARCLWIDWTERTQHSWFCCAAAVPSAVSWQQSSIQSVNSAFNSHNSNSWAGAQFIHNYFEWNFTFIWGEARTRGKVWALSSSAGFESI